MRQSGVGIRVQPRTPEVGTPSSALNITAILALRTVVGFSLKPAGVLLIPM